jgi:ATP-dependent helicase/nuclease subunit A
MITRRRSAEQLLAARPEASVWVSASAGSGKTSVLSDRVLRLLLLDGARPERLLCLTFTKAAAAEMKTRVMGELARWAASDDARLDAELESLLGRPADDRERGDARRLFARALDAAGGLKIQTLHGFCQGLLGRFPLEAEVVPYFEPADDRQIAELMLRARDRVLAEAQRGGPLAEALAAVTDRAIEDRFDLLVQAMAGERGRLSRLIAEHGIDGVIAKIYARHGADPALSEEQILAAGCGDLVMDLAALRRAAEALSRGGKSDQERGLALARFLAEPAKRRPLMFDACRSVFFTKEGELRARLATKPAEAHDPSVTPTLAAEAARLVLLDRAMRARRVAGSTASLLTVSVAILAAYEREKSARALLDYDDLILKTRDLLSREGVAPWVLFKLDGGLDHVLIDEAQDTNPDQWEVIERLVEEFFSGSGAREVERTIFVVGDYKQSIYSFQRADPAAFEQMRRRFAGRVPEAGKLWDEVSLDMSYRSAPAVLQGVDAVFARGEALAGVSPDGRPILHRPSRATAGGAVEVWPLVLPVDIAVPAPWTPPTERIEGHDPPGLLAQLLARRIGDWLESGEMLASRGRPIRPGDVMVLVRRRGTFLDALVRALKQIGVPVAGTDRITLTDQLAVMDLMALGQALLLPSDDLTLAIVLKGPLVGLSEEQLFRLAHGRAGTLWQSLSERRGEHADFAAAHALISDLLARVDFTPPFALLAYVLGPLGGRRKIQARLGPESLDALEELQNAAIAYERTHPPSLQGFLHWLAATASDIKRDLEHGVRDEVRVMTVHGAKGLQAPIVILPDTVQTPDRDPAVLWQDGLPLWSPRTGDDDEIAAEARRQSRARRDEEYRRLLYVAMTRAEDRLYVCGWRTRRAATAESWYDAVKAGLGELAQPLPVPGFEENGLRHETPQSAPVPAPDSATALETARPLPAWALAGAADEPRPPRPLAPSQPDDPEPPARSPLAADDALRFRRGKLVHRLLQSLPELMPGARAAAARRWLERPGQDLAPDQVAALIGETLAILEDPRFAELFGPASRPEVPISGLVGAHVVSGQVDRLVALPDRVLIVDYKTNRPAPEDLAAVAPLYLRQMAAYRAVLARIYPGRRIECTLLWTEGPRLMTLPDDLLDRYAPDAPARR